MNRFPSLVLTVACVAIPLAPAHGGFEDVLPAETLAFVGVDDVAALKKSCGDSAWGRFMSDPAFGSFQDWMSSQISDLAAKAEEETGTNPFDLLSLVEGSAAVFLLDLGVPEGGLTPGQDGSVGFGMLLGLGQNGDAFLDQFDALWATEVEAGKIVMGAEEIAGVDVTLIADAEEDAENPMEMRYGVKDGTLILTIISDELADRAYFETICAGLDDLVEETLDQTDRYVASLAADGAGSVRGFADIGEIVRRAMVASEARGSLDPDEKKMFETFGFSEIESMAILADLSAEGSRFDVELNWTGQGHLAEMLMAVFGPAELVTPKFVPAENVSMNAVRLDLGAGIDAVMSVMREIEPEEAAQAETMMEMFFQQDGFNVRTDIIDNLAGEIGFFQAKVDDEMEALPGTEEDPMSIAFLLPMTDGSKLEVAIDTLLRQSGMHATRKRDEFQGESVFSIPLPLLGSGLHYAIAENLLVASLSREMLEDVLRRHGGADLPTVAGSDAWGEARRLLDGDLPTSISFQDAAESVKGMMAAANLLASGEIPGVAVGGVPARDPAPFDLPDPELALKYFDGTSVTVFRIHERGMRATMTGP